MPTSTHQLTFRMNIIAKITPPVELGKTPDGICMNYPIIGGEFYAIGNDQSKIKGVVLPNGADFFRERADKVGILNAIYSLQTEAGQVINIQNTGLIRNTKKGQEMVEQGIWPIPESEYYCRCTPVFSAPEGPLFWLNDSIFTGSVTYPAADTVDIKVFELT
ncbi:hypothetical protein MSP8886_00306 [Marinomonas spartinae]|uniref:Uncharacterized protein n=1 Tax=Marinomonas spartinae TaxID=1792290 RepID=A0A1A8T3Y0_9GAMM|nr:DUF3237 domain-containing protein [Marinomonas spartinae]SBS25538.1 hypothetical protein MSP8886_00306 [Marinomonas spartinae]